MTADRDVDRPAVDERVEDAKVGIATAATAVAASNDDDREQGDDKNVEGATNHHRSSELSIRDRLILSNLRAAK